jgi:3',5'-cyclic AMP phosphodiesterase CpdA
MTFAHHLLADDRSGSPGGPDALELLTRRRPVVPDGSFVSLPDPVGELPYRLELDQVIGPDRADAIMHDRRLRFHALGDSGGDVDPLPQRRVAGALTRQLYGPQPGRFLYHLGDLVYPHGEQDGYRSQFWAPYADYRAPIFAVPGNHDADRKAVPGRSTLDPFVATFCSEASPLHDAADVPPRPPSRQPNVYWTLVHPWLRIIGLYTNVPEGGRLAADQLAWLVGELRAAPADTITILAMHQPIYSADVTHGSNLTLVDLLDRCFRLAGRRPDAVLSGHAHCYQRFSRRVDGRAIPHVVAGAGGYHELHPLGRGIGSVPMSLHGVDGLGDVTLEDYEDRAHGFLTVTVEPGAAEFVYNAVTSGTVYARDAFTIRAPASR